MNDVSISASASGPLLAGGRPVVRPAGYVKRSSREPMTWRFGDAYDLTFHVDGDVHADRPGHSGDEPRCDVLHREIGAEGIE